MHRGVSSPFERLPIKFSSLRNKFGYPIKKMVIFTNASAIYFLPTENSLNFQIHKIKIQNKTWDTETRQRITAILQHLGIRATDLWGFPSELFPLTKRSCSLSLSRGCRRFQNLSNAQYITPSLSGKRRRISIPASRIILVTRPINFTTNALEPTGFVAELACSVFITSVE
jgi:hypothetical protein